MTNELQCTKAMNANLPAGAEYFLQVQHAGRFMVYRENYEAGRPVCKVLAARESPLMHHC
jgi:hypothetical protein